MKKLATLAALTFVTLTGCNTPNNIEGQMALNAAINVNASQFFGGVKKVAVARGTYQTTLSLNQGGATVSINTQQGAVKFAVPTAAADAFGSVNASAAQLGQEFSIQGKIYDTSDGIDRTVGQSCIDHYDTRNVCNWENCCDRDGKDCRQEYRCRDESVPVYGTEQVHQVGSQTTKEVAINLVKAGKVVGKFSGSYTYNENITSSQVVSGCSM